MGTGEGAAAGRTARLARRPVGRAWPGVAGLDARGSGHQNRAMSFRRPLIALAVGVLMLLVALLLDRGGEGSRDMVLLIGTAALYVVLPASVL